VIRQNVAAVIAAYNAEETIAGVVSEARRHLALVLVADDGSTDGTGAAAEAAGATVLSLRKNRGKGEALRLLFAEARRRGCSAVIALDADGQHDPAAIPTFLRRYDAEPRAILTGSRLNAPGQMPPDRLDSMTVARFFVSLAANQFIEDSQCGYRLYPLVVLDSIALLKERYATETEILMKAGDSGVPIHRMPIEGRYPPGNPTHFRAVADVAAISRYVISYLMVKWAIEAVRPGTVYTYRGPRTGRDWWYVTPATDFAFEALMVAVALPLTAGYIAWHALARRLGIPAVASLGRSGIPLGSLLVSVWLLPVVMVVSIAEFFGRRLGIYGGLTRRLVRRHYAYPWAGAES